MESETFNGTVAHICGTYGVYNGCYRYEVQWKCFAGKIEGKGCENLSAACVVQVSAQYFPEVNYVRREKCYLFAEDMNIIFDCRNVLLKVIACGTERITVNKVRIVANRVAGI